MDSELRGPLKGDIWALGVVLLELMAGKYPFRDDHIVDSIINDPICVKGIVGAGQYSDELCQFVQNCLKRGVNGRGEPDRWALPEIEAYLKKLEVYENRDAVKEALEDFEELIEEKK